jgi:hypothetical protein
MQERHLLAPNPSAPKNLPIGLSESTALAPDEQQVVALKYKSKPISEMSEAEVYDWTEVLLLKIHVITGWTIPASDALMNILTDQFSKILTEKYNRLNPDEIEFAFRQEGTSMKDWGKAFNLSLVDSVLTPYLNTRFCISEMERQLHYYQRRPEFSLERDIDYRRQIEEDYQSFLGGRMRLVTFPIGYYDTLAEDGFFAASWWKQRARDYHRRYPEVDKKKLTEVAKDRCILQTFREARRRRYRNLYLKN